LFASRKKEGSAVLNAETGTRQISEMEERSNHPGRFAKQSRQRMRGKVKRGGHPRTQKSLKEIKTRKPWDTNKRERKMGFQLQKKPGPKIQTKKNSKQKKPPRREGLSSPVEASALKRASIGGSMKQRYVNDRRKGKSTCIRGRSISGEDAKPYERCPEKLWGGGEVERGHISWGYKA